MHEISSIDSTSELTNTVLRERAMRAHSGRSKEFVARVNGEEAGFLSYEDWQYRSQGFIYEVFILPAFRRQGIAALLLRHAELFAIQLHCKSIRLKPYALDQEPDTLRLITWYLSVGYSSTSDEPEMLEKWLVIPKT
jgi:GNAT superfamily N-acetyltransferase